MRLNDNNTFIGINPTYQLSVIHSSKLIYPREIYQLSLIHISGQSTDTAISFFSAEYTIPLMACATVSKLSLIHIYKEVASYDMAF